MVKNGDEIYDSRFPWITRSFVFDLVKKTGATTSLEIQSVELKSALAKGENYASSIVRLTVCYKTGNGQNDFAQRKSFIQKSEMTDGFEEFKQAVEQNRMNGNDAPPDDGFKKFSDMVFMKETHAYTYLLPRISRVLNANTLVAPIWYASSNTPNSYIVVEDLGSSGYSNVDKRIGLDFNHMKCVLRKLAIWHATTANIILDPNAQLHEFKSPIIEFDSNFTKIFIANMILAIADNLRQQSDGIDLAEKCGKLVESGGTRCLHEYKTNVVDFNVIIHGDLWCNNILFKYDDQGKAIDAKLVDFAHCYIGSPALDLAHLIFTSSHSSLRELEWDKLLQYYHKELCLALKSSNYPKQFPTLRDIRVQFLNSGLYTAVTGIFMQNLRVLEKDYCNDNNVIQLFMMPSNGENDRSIRARILSNPKAAIMTKYLLEYYDRKGFL